MAYKHGVYVNEQATSMVAPVEGTAGLQVIVGTAPVNMAANPAAAVNKPILVTNFAEAVEAVGYLDDFEKYTLCEAISATFSVVGTGPVVLINVLDPAVHKTAMTGGTVTVNNLVAKVQEVGAIVSSLTVKKNSTTLVKGTDYEVSFNDDGTLNIILSSTGSGADATELTVTGDKISAAAVTAADIVGGVTVATGEEKGLEVIRQIFPLYGMTPGILSAPRFSKNATVAAALQAKTRDINGVFRCVCVVDIDCNTTDGAKKYSDVKTKKDAQGVSSETAYAVWPYAKVGTKVYSGSSIASALTALTDAQNDDVPNVSPSNKSVAISAICLEDGTEVVQDQTQANVVNAGGVATFLNFNGWRLWGNNTAAYPGNTDPKDRFFSVRRFMSWAANTFILTYFQKVDSPMNPRLIESIVDSENVRGNSFVARGICARYEIQYIAEENPTADLLNGSITFHQYMTPYTPAEDIEDIIEFDPEALAAAFG